MCGHIQKLQTISLIHHQELFTSSFEAGFLTELGDHRLAQGSSEILLFLAASAGIKKRALTCLALMRVLGDGLRSSCVHNKHSNDHSHSAREPLKNPLITMQEAGYSGNAVLCYAGD